jgi:hypothetical protein
LVAELRHTLAHQLFIQVALEAHNGFLNTLGLAPRLGRDFITRQPLKRLPSRFWQGLSQLDNFRMSIHPKNELNPLAIPTIQLGAQRKIGVTAQRDLTGTWTYQLNRPIDPGYTAFMADSVAGPVDQIKDFAGIGQSDD